MKTYNFTLLCFSFLILLSCDQDRDDVDNNFLLLEMRDNPELPSVENPFFEITLYAYNEALENPDTLRITSADFGALEFPFAIRMDIPPNPYEKFENLEDEDNARFFITMQWDSDGNGQNCTGDIDLDERVENVEWISITRRDAQSIFLSTLQAEEPCN